MARGSIKFVASDAAGLPVKRKQVQHACSACRRRKKRCTHTSEQQQAWFSTDSPPGVRGAEGQRPQTSAATYAQSSAQGSRLPLSPESASSGAPRDDHALPDDSSTEAASGLVELSSSRFIGDMNPEAVFIQATSTNQSNHHSLYRDRSDVGTWFPPGVERLEPDSPAPPSQDRDSYTQLPVHPNMFPATLFSRQSFPSEEASWAALARTNCINVLPPDDDFEVLRNIYLERVHPLFPVFNTSDVEGEHPSRAARVLVKQLISLAAGMEGQAKPHLRLEPGGPILSFQEFHYRLARAIFTILDATALISRVDRVRVLTMMSLYYQPSCSAEREVPALLCSQAIFYAQSLGIHLQGYRPQRPDENIEQLFCAVWALDRLMTMYGRPCIYHERDIDRDLDECIAKQAPSFRLFLKVVQYLDAIVELYRPRHNRKSVPHIDLPVFEGMVLDAGAQRVPTLLLGTIETLYHTVSVLSVRQPSSAWSPCAPERDHLPHPAINPRRSLSADRIQMAVQSGEVCLVPWIPYAVSVSLTVSYRKMRYSKVPMYRARAKGVFKEIVGMLKKLGEVYYSARTNAELGESILREMEKTANSLTTSAEAAPARRETAGIPSQEQLRDEARDTSGLAVGTRSGAVFGVPASTRAATRRGTTTAVEVASTPEGTPGLDSVLLGNPEEIDLFGYFDPDFNLGAVDAALEANLDMGYPQDRTAPWYTFPE